MNKINNLQQLQLQKERLLNKQLTLQMQIQSNWVNLKHELQPSELLNNMYQTYLFNQSEKAIHQKSFIENSIHYGVSALSNKVWGYVGNVVKKYFTK